MTHPPTAQDGTCRTDGLTTYDELDGCPVPPKTLSRGAVAEWLQLAPVAYARGNLGDADMRALEMLCECLATERMARDALARDGLTTVGGNGGQKSHPAIKVLEAARAQSIRLMAHFGLTPRSRASVPVIAPDDDSDEFQIL